MALAGRAPGMPSPKAGGADARLLFIRTDAIGDAVLAADQLRILHERWPQACLAVACPEPVADLYRAAPFAIEVLAFDPARFRLSWKYRLKTIGGLRAFRPTHVLNGMATRTFACDLLAILAGAGVRLGWAQAGARSLKERVMDAAYSHLMPPMEGHELQRNGAFLEWIGLDAAGYSPRIWSGIEDHAWVDATLESLGLKGRSFIVLFAGADLHRRGYSGYGLALNEAFPDAHVPVVAVGSANDRADNENNLSAYAGPTFNLCGETNLSRLAALVSNARLAFGAETGVSHIACAVGVPQVVLMGGGHFGRFHPYSPLTTLACMPLGCFGCNWACRYPRAHCIHDVPPGLLAAALREAWAGPSAVPSVLYAEWACRAGEHGPQGVSPQALPLWTPVRWQPWRIGAADE